MKPFFLLMILGGIENEIVRKLVNTLCSTLQLTARFHTTSAFSGNDLVVRALDCQSMVLLSKRLGGFNPGCCFQSHQVASWKLSVKKFMYCQGWFSLTSTFGSLSQLSLSFVNQSQPKGIAPLFIQHQPGTLVTLVLCNMFLLDEDHRKLLYLLEA